MISHADRVNWEAIAAHISYTTGQFFQIETRYSITGGYLNEAYRIEGAGQNYFVKLNYYTHFDMFAAEAAGLAEISQPAVIKAPLPLCWGTVGEVAYLVTEYIAVRSDMQTAASAQLGQQLAVMHQVFKVPYGWHRHNYIGLTPQNNTLEHDWITFWRDYRLGSQLELAARNGYSGRLQTQGERLCEGVGQFFAAYQPHSSLLHGDLWAGNYAVDIYGQPVIFDPAVYYGDRETDIAMTELFGGFSASFYDAYQERWPLDIGYPVRKTLYNLYHVLNHLNLFGGGYLTQAEQMIDLLLSEL